MSSGCTKLADRFSEMERKGFVDVKFFLRPSDEFTADEVCEEANALWDAYERGDHIELDFKDSKTR